MADKRWKRSERAIAGKLGGDRVPITGRQRGDAPDIKHPKLALECKDRERLPGWLHTGMEQAVKSIRGNQLPVVILHEKGRHHDNDLALIKLRDLVKLIKE